MKVIIDRAALEKRASRAHAASLGGLLLLLGSVAVSLFRPDLATLTSIMIVLGFAISVVGIYSANRWVKKPRPEDTLDQALKGLGNNYRLYHYLQGIDHLLLTPFGLTVLETINLEGEFRYDGKRWRQRITAGRAMRFFVEEKLGNPVNRARQMGAALAQRLSMGKEVPIDAMVVFTHPRAQVSAKSPPIPVCQPKDLRRKVTQKRDPLPTPVYESICTELDHMCESS